MLNNPESLASGKKFEFTTMQTDLWASLSDTGFVHDK
jgi:hypothetical protein